MTSIQEAKDYISQLSTGTVSGEIPKFAIITGGTTGIGPSIALSLARIGCRRIVIVGRNATAGEIVLDQMREENNFGEYSMIQGDLSTLKGMSGIHRAIQDQVDKLGVKVDSLIMCQNGMPTGEIKLTEDGNGFGFAVQALSRFHLAYTLIGSEGLARGARVVCLANPGVSLNDLDVDDLSLEKRENSWSAKLFVQQSMRDSTVLDSFLQEMTIRYPDYHFYHVHPGFVKTATIDLSIVPRPFSWLMTAAYFTLATTPKHIANIPVYLSVVDEKRRSDLGSDRFFNHNLKAISPGVWSRNEENRQKLWTRLVELIQ